MPAFEYFLRHRKSLISRFPPPCDVAIIQDVLGPEPLIEKSTQPSSGFPKPVDSSTVQHWVLPNVADADEARGNPGIPSPLQRAICHPVPSTSAAW